MAKRRIRRTKTRPMPEPTRTLTGVARELDEARKWQVRQIHKPTYWKLKRIIDRVGLLAAYRARKDAGNTE